jgi:hypothetical protein
VLESFLLELVAIASEAHATHSPMTGVARTRRVIATRLQGASGAAMTGDALLLVERMLRDSEDFGRVLLTRERELKENVAQLDARSSLLLRVAGEADVVAPHLTAMIWQSGAPDDAVLDERRAGWHLENAANAKGEPRLFHVMAAISPVVDFVYAPFLRALVELARVTKAGTAHAARLNLFDLLPHARRAFPQDEYSGLIEPTTTILRNCAAHSNWGAYDDVADELEIWNTQNGVRTTPQRISVEELYARVSAMWRLAGQTFWMVRSVLLVRMMRDLVLEDDALRVVRALLREDQDALQVLTSEIDRRISIKLGPAGAVILEMQ